MKDTNVICSIIALACLLLAGVVYLCTHGIQEIGTLSVTMTSNHKPAFSEIVGKRFPLDSDSQIEITAISHNLNADGPSNYKIHADVSGVSKHRFSINELSWNQSILVSSAKVEKQLRLLAALPADAATSMNSDMLQP